jgi:hypothetical protein
MKWPICVIEASRKEPIGMDAFLLNGDWRTLQTAQKPRCSKERARKSVGHAGYGHARERGWNAPPATATRTTWPAHHIGPFTNFEHVSPAAGRELEDMRPPLKVARVSEAFKPRHHLQQRSVWPHAQPVVLKDERLDGLPAILCNDLMSCSRSMQWHRACSSGMSDLVGLGHSSRR